MPRTILIVDDNKLELALLSAMLKDRYDILTAGSGEELFSVLEQCAASVSAILLDILMPEMDGFEVLGRLRENAAYAQIPVIVATSLSDEESLIRAMSLGASNYASKPYNRDLLMYMLENAIKLRETAALVNSLSIDTLTCLPNRTSFFEMADSMIRSHAPGYYIIACFDIENFKVLNDQYGIEKGDEVLRTIAETIREGMASLGGICCRFMADKFGMMYPAALKDGETIQALHTRVTASEYVGRSVKIRIGRYLVNDLSIPVSAMYDRATMAEESIKGRYGTFIATYDDSMRQELLHEQQIVSDMNRALEAGEFVPWFQPQYNHATGALIGAEALVRWVKDGKIVPPAEFIPVFERNGFIYEMDQYIWEQVCRLMRRWLDEGKAPLPVSVNISRKDVFHADFLEVLTGLMKKYELPYELIRLEITESAFAESSKTVIHTVNALIKQGFTVEIDDFGSGYSSLNTLKDVPASILKLDMKFLENTENTQRSGNIVESMVRMAKWLGMAVIAEGVEDRAQADHLKSIGCHYIQGYYYARPMPAEEYEALTAQGRREPSLSRLVTVENYDNAAFWDPHSIDTLIFNSYVGGACICEYCGGKTEVIRCNEEYDRIFSGSFRYDYDSAEGDSLAFLDENGKKTLLDNVEKAVVTRKASSCEVCLTDGEGNHKYLHVTVRLIARAGERFLLYAVLADVTEQRAAEKRELADAQRVRHMVNGINAGVTVSTMRGGKPVFLTANEPYYEMLGYTSDQFAEEVGNKYDLIYPEDRERVVRRFENADSSEQHYTMEYRAYRRDGSVGWFRSGVGILHIPGEEEFVQISVISDITAEKNAEAQRNELLDNLPVGAALYRYENGTAEVVHINKTYWELVDRSPKERCGKTVLDAVHPDDRPLLKQEMAAAIRQNRNAAVDVRIRYGADGYRPFHMTANIITKGEGKYALCASYFPISEQAMSIQEMLPIALSTLMSASEDFSYVKDSNLRYICCSDSVSRLLGLGSTEEVIGKTAFDLFDAKLAEQFTADEKQIIATGKSLLDTSESIPLADGSIRLGRTSKYPLMDAEGKVIGVYGISHDVTAQREKESQLELLASSIPGGLASYAVTDDGIKMTFFNDGFFAFSGYTREEFLKLTEDNPLALIFEEDRPKIRSLFFGLSGAKLDGGTGECVFRCHTKDGGCRYMSLKAVLTKQSEERFTLNAVQTDITGQVEEKERLRVSEEEYRVATQHSGRTICRYDIPRRTVTISAEDAQRLSLPECIEDVPYGRVKLGKISPETAETYIAFYEDIIAGEKEATATFQKLLPFGWRWLSARGTTIFDDGGKPVPAIISYVDATELQEREAIYRKWQQSLREKGQSAYTLYRCNLCADQAYDSVEGTLLNVQNELYRTQSFSACAEDFAARYVFEEDREKFLEFLNADAMMANYYRGKPSARLEFRAAIASGEIHWLRLSAELVEYPNTAGVEAFLMFEDIHSGKLEELQTKAQAETDPLTGLLNRKTFAERVNHEISHKKKDALCALFLIDLDCFKLVNDSFGHKIGDQVLIYTGNAIRTTLRDSDLLCRMGGDEFLVFLNDMPDRDTIMKKAKQLCTLIQRSFHLDIRMSISVGISVCPGDGDTFDTLLSKADKALYHVKGSGKDNCAFYQYGMTISAVSTQNGDFLPINETAAKPRMLIVDDRKENRKLLKNVFSDEFDVETAEDGATALSILHRSARRYSVILLDLIMPDMDGFAVLEQMRGSEQTAGIPVVVVSGMDERDATLRVIKAGAAEFVPKPIDAGLLRIRVTSAISKAENDRLRAQNQYLSLLRSSEKGSGD